MPETIVSISLKNTLSIVLMVAVGLGIVYGVIALAKHAGQAQNG